jgi:hypothetical protein
MVSLSPSNEIRRVTYKMTGIFYKRDSLKFPFSKFVYDSLSILLRAERSLVCSTMTSEIYNAQYISYGTKDSVCRNIRAKER